MAQLRNYSTKLEGSTEVDPIWNLEDMYKMIEYFKVKEDWNNYLIFKLASLLVRRIGDIVMLKWCYFFDSKGERCKYVTTIKEQKTGKYIKLPLANEAFESIELYCEKTGINPLKHLNEYIFNTKSKTAWLERKASPIYLENDLDAICKKLGKDYGDKRKREILEGYNGQFDESGKIRKKKHIKVYDTLGEYIYNEVEYADIVKWQSDNFRKELKKAADYANIKYPVSCHTLRKSLGLWLLKMHPDDAQVLYVVQKILGHPDPATTLAYIGLSGKKVEDCLNDYGNLMHDVEKGNTKLMINNSPIVSFRHDDLRKILIFAIQSNNDSIETLNKAMNMVDQLKIKHI